MASTSFLYAIITNDSSVLALLISVHVIGTRVSLFSSFYESMMESIK